MKTTIIYWSSTGNTEKMANLIGQGLLESETDMEVQIKHVGDSNENDILQSDLVLLGSPAMGVEEIDTSEMEPFILNNKQSFNGKLIGLFGSYGWGDGEWMDSWDDMMTGLGAKIVMENLMVNEAPEDDSEQKCLDYGRKASLIPEA